LLILESALEEFDQMRQAQKMLKRDGITIKDRYGVMKMHPCVTIEMNAKQTVARLFKTLHLNLNPEKQPPGRPPGR
jgi:phage terminase small subunit